MGELHQRFNETWEADQHHRLLLAGAYTLDFLIVHPFADGNGRMSRLLSLLLLEDRALRSDGIDRGDLVPARREREGCLPVAATDVENPRRRVGELREHEIGKPHDREDSNNI